MNQASIHAQPPLEYIPPNFNPWLYRGVKNCLPLWLQWQTTIQEIEGNNVEQLFAKHLVSNIFCHSF